MTALVRELRKPTTFSHVSERMLKARPDANQLDYNQTALLIRSSKRSDSKEIPKPILFELIDASNAKQQKSIFEARVEADESKIERLVQNMESDDFLAEASKRPKATINLLKLIAKSSSFQDKYSARVKILLVKLSKKLKTRKARQWAYKAASKITTK